MNSSELQFGYKYSLITRDRNDSVGLNATNSR